MANDDLMDTKSKKKSKSIPKKDLGPLGRPISKATTESRKKILAAAKKKDGIGNVDLAKLLGFGTAKTQALCRPMILAKELKLKKDKLTNRVTYVVA